MPQTSFIFDEETDQLLESLKADFGVTTKAQVVRKALGLAKVAARLSNKEDHTITMKDAKGVEQIILLKG